MRPSSADILNRIPHLPTYCSQELLEAVEEERNDVQENHARTTTVFRHPLLGDFEVLTYIDLMFTFRVEACFQ